MAKAVGAETLASDGPWWEALGYVNASDVVVDVRRVGHPRSRSWARAARRPDREGRSGPEPYQRRLDTLVAKAAELHGAFSHTWSRGNVPSVACRGRLDPTPGLEAFDFPTGPTRRAPWRRDASWVPVIGPVTRAAIIAFELDPARHSRRRGGTSDPACPDNEPVVQTSLDLTSIEQALAVADVAVEAGVQWLEAGTPLILAEGVRAISALHARFPDHPIVADLKIMDGGGLETDLAAEAGASFVVVMSRATDATVRSVVSAAHARGVLVMGDVWAAATMRLKLNGWSGSASMPSSPTSALTSGGRTRASVCSIF